MPQESKKYIADEERLMREWDWEANAGLNPNTLTYGSNKKSGGNTVDVAENGKLQFQIGHEVTLGVQSALIGLLYMDLMTSLQSFLILLR